MQMGQELLEYNNTIYYFRFIKSDQNETHGNYYCVCVCDACLVK